jgi:hypothetical protein
MSNHPDDKHFLASKVDALLSKHQPHANAADERNIPVLTDLVDAPQWSPEQKAMRAASSQNVLATLADDELDQLAQDILQRVSQRLDAEIATALEARISEHLAAQVNAAVTHVLSDMRLSIANEIGDAVNAALADRLRNR